MSRVVRTSILLALFAVAGRFAWADFPSEFERWSSFNEGTSVSMEMTVDSNGKQFTTKATMTLKKKEADKVTITVLAEMNGKQMPSERVILKDQEKQECKLCHKVHKAPVIKEGAKDKVKIGDKEYDTTILEVTAYSCNDKESQVKVWRCDDLPGMTARTETTTDHGKMVMTVTGFDKK